MTLVHAPSRRRFVLGLCCGTFVLGLPTASMAQAAFPTKPIRLIVAFAPGGGSDFIARLVATKMSEKLGQPVIVENKPGAGGNMGAALALKSPADGYTLFLAAASYTVNPALYKLPFDSINDITPIAQLARGPFIVAVNPKLPANTVQEMIGVAKKSPGALSYGSAGTGSITHLVSEYFLDMTGTNMLHIPYRGTSPALVDAVAGQVQLVFGTVASTLPFIKSGQLRALAVTTESRLVALPQVPTMIESGLPNFAVTNWHGVIAPKGVPADIVKKLNAVINDSLQAPGMKEGLESDGLTAASGSPQAFGVLLAEETKRWGAVVKKRGIKVE